VRLKCDEIIKQHKLQIVYIVSIKIQPVIDTCGVGYFGGVSL